MDSMMPPCIHVRRSVMPSAWHTSCAIRLRCYYRGIRPARDVGGLYHNGREARPKLPLRSQARHIGKHGQREDEVVAATVGVGGGFAVATVARKWGGPSLAVTTDGRMDAL